MSTDSPAPAQENPGSLPAYSAAEYAVTAEEHREWMDTISCKHIRKGRQCDGTCH